jgi:mannose-1-phosphate guanylyltransferase
LAALNIARDDAHTRLVFVPSDHYVEDEAVLQSALRVAATRPLHQDDILLLGLEPTGPDPELGYIVPRSSCRPLECQPVCRFAEKPTSDAATKLIREGALWNSFIFVAGVRTIVDLMQARYPTLAGAFEIAVGAGAPAVTALYERLVNIDFSRDILQGVDTDVSVLRVPECGRSDLGTPRSVLTCLKRLSRETVATCRSESISLAVALATSAA